VKKLIQKIKSFFHKDKKQHSDVKPLELVKMRMPRSSHQFETLVDMNLFELKYKTETELFGYYGNTFVVIEKNKK
jgi:hypothetical protein